MSSSSSSTSSSQAPDAVFQRPKPPFRYTNVQRSPSNVSTEYDLNFIRVVTIGNFNVGKTKILKRISTDTYTDERRSTEQLDIIMRHLELTETGTRVKMMFFDCVGQSIKSTYESQHIFKHGDAAIAVFDFTEPSTFEALYEWKTRVACDIDDEFYLVVVCNKIDMADKDNEMHLDRVYEWRERARTELGAHHFMLVSAKTGGGCDVLVYEIVRSVLEMRERLVNQEFATGVPNKRLRQLRGFQLTGARHKNRYRGCSDSGCGTD
jgi:small GTP-binding protein